MLYLEKSPQLAVSSSADSKLAMSKQGQSKQDAFASLEIEMMSDLYNRYAVIWQMGVVVCSVTTGMFTNLCPHQVVQNLPQQVHSSQVQRGRVVQRRSDLSGPMRCQVSGDPRQDWEETDCYVYAGTDYHEANADTEEMTRRITPNLSLCSIIS